MESIKEWYLKMVKTFTIQIDELQGLMNESAQILSNDEVELYKLLTKKS